MQEQWRTYFALWARSEAYRNNLAEANKIIQSSLDDKAYVACSGGKDSLALLHLCQKFKPDVSVFHWDHGAALMPRVIQHGIEDCMNACAPGARFQIRRFHKGTSEDARVDYYSWYKAFYGTLARMKKEFGFTKCFLGLRAEESSRRKARLGANDQSSIYPLKDWSWRDVWALIVSEKIKYPSVYDEYAELLGYEQARLVTFHDSEFDKFGSRNLDNLLMWREKHL